MQDKEFDELFRNKLDGFESAPSGMVWENINAQLDQKPRYRKLVPYMGIAASIIVLAAASVLFIPKKTGVQPGHQPKNIIAKNKTEQPVIKEQVQPKAQVPTVAQPVKKEENVIAHVKPHKAVPVVQAVDKSKVSDQAISPKSDQPVLAATSPKVDVIKPVVPEKTTPLVDKPIVNDAQVIAATSQPAATSTPADNNKPEEMQVKRKHHEREGLGGLLNKLIAKVDKRKDKVIEFTDDADEGESNITGLNLGVFKIKKEKVAK